MWQDQRNIKVFRQQHDPLSWGGLPAAFLVHPRPEEVLSTPKTYFNDSDILAERWLILRSVEVQDLGRLWTPPL